MRTERHIDVTDAGMLRLRIVHEPQTDEDREFLRVFARLGAARMGIDSDGKGSRVEVYTFVPVPGISVK